MNLLITGGCGFIGVNLIKFMLLNEKKTRIRVLDNLSVGRPEDLMRVTDYTRVEAAAVQAGPASQVELLVGDILDRKTVQLSFRGMDAVVHLAANTGVLPSIEDPYADCLSNVVGTLNCLESARMNGMQRFVLASSGAPLGEQVPPIHEEMVPRPLSPYGASKLSGEAYCSAYHGSFELDTVALRFGNVYGPFSTHKGSVVAKFIRHLLAAEDLPVNGDGSQTRDFVYVEDLVRAICQALLHPGIGGELFQIATQREHSVSEVAILLNRLAMELLGRQSDIIHKKALKGEVQRNYADITKAEKRLGFKPSRSLEKGLRQTLLWFLEREDREWDKAVGV